MWGIVWKYRKQLLPVALVVAGLIGLIILRSHWIEQGKNMIRLKLANETNQQTIISEKQSNEVAKRVKSFDERKLDDYLCGLGIVYENNGCK